MRYLIAIALATALALGPAAFAGSTDWGNASNGSAIITRAMASTLTLERVGGDSRR